MDKKHSRLIKDTVFDILDKMGFEVGLEDINLDSSDDNNLVVNIQTDQANFLIGQSGANLQSLQYLARLLVNKKNKEEEPVYFVLDINNYKQNKNSLLKELALNTANQVTTEKIPLFLRPMSSYDRRIIHLTLANHPQVITESISEGEERRIMVKLKLTD